MRNFFFIVISLHALIHFVGFMKAFKIAKFSELTIPISKSIGTMWLLAGTMLFSALLLFYYQYSKWWVVGLAGLLISQGLIFYFWQYAKFGSIINVLFLLLCLTGIGRSQFDNTVKSEIQSIKNPIHLIQQPTATSSQLDSLPPVVKKWLHTSGAAKKRFVQSVSLQQSLQLKMSPDQKSWTSASAYQYFNVANPSFVWSVDIPSMYLLPVQGRDKFVDGKGEMLIKFASLIPVVDEKNNHKIDEGSLQRFLAETAWFPTAAISPYISWEQLDENSAQANMTYQGTSGSGTFYFDDFGNFKKFETLRYRGGEEKSERSPWIIEVQKSNRINGIVIPTELTCTWMLDNEEWTWLKVKITAIEYE